MMKFLQSRFGLLLMGIILIGAGLTYAIRSGRGAIDSFRSIQFATEHNFDGGNPDIELISHWMNIRYIAEAYTVPQSFLFDEIGIEMNRPNSELPLRRLNRRYDFGDSELGDPALVDHVRDAILAYRENPVVTGLSEGNVRRWMNVTYIANSTGVSVEIFFDALGLPVAGYAYMPLDRLVDQSGYQPGVGQLIQVLEQTIDTNEGER